MKRLFTLLAICSTLGIITAQVPSYVPLSGLQGFWPFTGNANDISGNAHNGTVTGATLTNDRFNFANSAYLYNGTSDYISTNYPGVLGTSARAISFWAAVDVSAQDHLHAIGWGDNSTGPSSAGNRMTIAFNNIGSFFYPSVSLAYCIWGHNPSPAINNLVWHHYVFQVVGNSTVGQFDIYEDAVKLNSPTTAQNTGTTTVMTTANGNNMVTFGMLDQAGTFLYFFKGKLDDIGIWNRVLDTCEIRRLYTGQIACNKTSLIENKIKTQHGTLGQNHPNPFFEETCIPYNLPENFNTANLIMTNYLGEIVKKIAITNNGPANLTLTSTDFPPGIYFYSLVADGYIIEQRKLIKL